MSQIKVTVREYLQAIRENGYTQAFGSRINSEQGVRMFDKHTIMAACAIGQADLNLGIDQTDYVGDSVFNAITHRIIGLNDDAHLSLEEIVLVLEAHFANDLDYEVTIPYHDYGRTYTNWQGLKLGKVPFDLAVG